MSESILSDTLLANPEVTAGHKPSVIHVTAGPDVIAVKINSAAVNLNMRLKITTFNAF